MAISSIVRSIVRSPVRSLLGASAGVSPAALSAAIVLAANGALYDPSDLTSLYQSRTGGSTGASGSPVGIMLDKSYMGGRSAAQFIASQAELCPNGDFSSATGWTLPAGSSISGGSLNFAASTFATPNIACGLVNGTWYRLTYNLTVTGTASVYNYLGSAGTFIGAAVTTSQTVTVVAQANGTTGRLQFYGDMSGGGTASIDNVSVKAIPGFHALAPSDAARPLLTVAGSLAYLTTDGVDDWMNVTPTLNLGEAWWHVGGWRSDTAGRAAFGLSNVAGILKAALAHAGTGAWSWRNAADSGYTDMVTGNPATINVTTVQQTATASIQARYNGVSGSAFAPFDDSAATQGLALFSGSNAVWANGLAGRFYGGAFAPGALTSGNRAIVEAYVAALAGVTLA